MNNTINHIGLQINEKDLNFYFEILNCTKVKSFILTNHEALTIFNIDAPVKVIYVMLEDLKLELSLTNIDKKSSFNHICIQSIHAEDIAINAKFKGYKTFTKINEVNSTFFIHDSSNNIFEIKYLK
jgi:hypothetical protein